MSRKAEIPKILTNQYLSAVSQRYGSSSDSVAWHAGHDAVTHAALAFSLAGIRAEADLPPGAHASGGRGHIRRAHTPHTPHTPFQRGGYGWWNE